MYSYMRETFRFEHTKREPNFLLSFTFLVIRRIFH